MRRLFILIVTVTVSFNLAAQKKKKESSAYPIQSSHIPGSFRNVGPALTAGRISDIAVNPDNHSEYYLAIASGGVFKTTNSGVTYEPVFDNYGSYSIGCVAISSQNKNIVWVGTGENNNQRSVAYGDGIYKSTDGGANFENMGLKSSEHISKILVHPTDENKVYAAAYGPLWRAGGDRGVFISEDGGKTWKNYLKLSENNGVSDLIMDPENPEILYAATHQRRRHVFTYLGGGPESAIYKSTDGGKTWTELKNGLPVNKMGRIGLAVSPADPNYVYAIIEAQDDKQGFYRSTDKGMHWTKMSGHKTSGNYYQEIYCDLEDKNKVFSMDTWLHHTSDGGKTFVRTGETNKHVDNHCIWIDPNNANHWRVGCDGGLYETWDHANTWEFKQNLPITQFYKVAVDYATPFYNIYGGTQDNNSLGGPSNTLNNAGILNSDWFITNGGDGFESQVDPKDPNIVYAQAQYGWLVRYNKATGEKIGIQPQPGKGEAPYTWNWDAPLLISPHNNKTLYFCANKVFKSADQGNSWQVISDDLTENIDRNELEVMGKTWSKDAIMKHKSTTIYGNIVAFDESPVKQGLLYAGTDDGNIQISENDGVSWTKVNVFPGVPKNTYVNMLLASQHDENVVYALFNDHKRGNFKPMVYKSADKGKTWVNISNDLPERGSSYAIAEDFKSKELLFVGTEFGLFTSLNGGSNWVQMKKGLPTIAIRDIAIQKTESDLVLASFGRGFYVYDDYSHLRNLSDIVKNNKNYLFEINDAMAYIPNNPLGLRGKGSQGAGLYTADNQDFGAVFYTYLKDGDELLKDQRRKTEHENAKDGKSNQHISLADLETENEDEKAYLLYIIKDNAGTEIKRIKTSLKKGINKMVWNLRLPSTNPIKLSHPKVGRYSNPDEGRMVLPGKYTVSILKVKNGEVKDLNLTRSFKVEFLHKESKASDLAVVKQFNKDLAETRRLIRGADKVLNEYNKKIKYMESAIIQVPNTPTEELANLKTLKKESKELSYLIWGNYTLGSMEVSVYPGFGDRLETIVYQTYGSTSTPTKTQVQGVEIAKSEYAEFRGKLDAWIKKIDAIEKKLEDLKIPYTPGKGTNWKQD